MRDFVLKFLIWGGLFSGHVCVAEDTQPMSEFVKEMVERINQRYDDFFRYHREMEERMARFEVGRGERKAAEKRYYDELERARVEYVKNKKAKDSTEHLRVQWEREEKERREKMEMFRQRHVRARDEIERHLLRGRKIPELKEYDLEGY